MCLSRCCYEGSPTLHCQRGYLITYVNFYFPLFECIHDPKTQVINTIRIQFPSPFELSLDNNNYGLINYKYQRLGSNQQPATTITVKSTSQGNRIYIRPRTSLITRAVLHAYRPMHENPFMFTNEPRSRPNYTIKTCPSIHLLL